MQLSDYHIEEPSPVPVGRSSILIVAGPDAEPNTPSALVAGTPTAGGSVTPGTHSYKVTFVTTYGESLPSVKSNVITAVITTGQTVPLSSIPLGGAKVIARKIYRTVAGDTGAWKLLTTIADNTTTVFSDTIADGSLGADAPTVSTTNNTPVACRAISVATTGNYTLTNPDRSTKVIYLLSGTIHWISTKDNLTSGAGTVTYWY